MTEHQTKQRVHRVNAPDCQEMTESKAREGTVTERPPSNSVSAVTMFAAVVACCYMLLHLQSRETNTSFPILHFPLWNSTMFLLQDQLVFAVVLKEKPYRNKGKV